MPAKKGDGSEFGLSEDERAETLQFARRRRDRPRAAKAQVTSKPGKPLGIDFKTTLDLTRFVSAFGTSELDYADLMFSGIVNAACDGSSQNPPSERDVNRALAAVTGIGAKDEIEGMLATQMIATHFAAINALRRLKGCENIPQQDSNGGLAVKLLRTFTMQLEALQRYRGKGHQKVVVEHVHVHAGAQAIVGSVAPRKGDRRQSGERGIEPREVTHEPTTPLRSPDPCREAVPIAGSSRKTAL
jgi:hypothetical protein